MPGAERILVFARAPRPGAAKTRLIPALGERGAAALHAKLIEHTLETARNADVGPIELHGTPGDDHWLHACAERYGASFAAQSDGDLGARMQAALERALRSGARPLLIGSDCAALTARHLREAAGALDEHDAVFAPTEDGGYALIGLTRSEAALFAGMPWSTDAVMAETRKRLDMLGFRWHELETLWDVDRPDDYRRLVKSGLLEAAATLHST